MLDDTTKLAALPRGLHPPPLQVRTMTDQTSFPIVFEHKWSTVCPQQYRLEFDGKVLTLTNGVVLKVFPDVTSAYGLHELNQLSFVAAKKWVNGSLHLKSGIPPLFFELARNDEMNVFFTTLKAALFELGSNQPSTNQFQKPEVTLSDELTKLAELHKAGILSDDEFSIAKGKFLEG